MRRTKPILRDAQTTKFNPRYVCIPGAMTSISSSFLQAFLRRVSITKPQEFLGHISQMAAALTHHVTEDRLRLISSLIPKVTIVTGDLDNLVLPQHSKDLKACMPEAEFIQWTETGHGIHAQRPDKFNALLERTFREGVERARAA